MVSLASWLLDEGWSCLIIEETPGSDRRRFGRSNRGDGVGPDQMAAGLGRVEGRGLRTTWGQSTISSVGWAGGFNMKEGRVDFAYQGEIRDATKTRQTLVVSLNGTRNC